MGKLIDLTGKRYGMLYVEKRVGSNKHGQPLWLCKCDCGNTIIISGQPLRKGFSQSCGCYKDYLNKMGLRNKKHGMFGTRIYTIWAHMIQRCENPNDAKYKIYGERGINVCKEWHDLNVFYQWALNNNYSDNLSIDRIDVNGNYEPSNCRWADRITQENNRRNNRIFTIDGVTHTVTEWARLYNKRPALVIQRINIYGYSIIDALTIPVKNHRKE